MELISKKAPLISVIEVSDEGEEETENVILSGVELTFEAVIGPHDISVIRVDDVDGFYDWLLEFYRDKGIEKLPGMAQGYRSIIKSYIDRGINYFVFDIVDLGEDPKTISPLMYRFDTDYLYYPLYISSKTPGESKIDLFLITPGTLNPESLPARFAIEGYSLPDDISGEPVEEFNYPITLTVDLIERIYISPPVATTIPGWETPAFLTTLSYKGPLKYLKTDLILDVEDFSEADFEGLKDSLGEADRLAEDLPDGMKNIIADGISIKTGGTDEHTSRVAVDGNPTTPYILPLKGRWIIDLGKVMVIEAVDIIAAVTQPDIEPSNNTLYLYRSNTGRFTGEEVRINSVDVKSYTILLSGDNPYLHARKISMTDKKIKTRWLMIEYPFSESTSPIYLFEVLLLGQ